MNSSGGFVLTPYHRSRRPSSESKKKPTGWTRAARWDSLPA